MVRRGGQVNNPAPSVINTYGGDIANFSKFKGNDRNDAMRLTKIGRASCRERV